MPPVSALAGGAACPSANVRGQTPGQQDHFATATQPHLRLKLAQVCWPPAGEFPATTAQRGRDQIWTDLTTSKTPWVLAGFASIAKIVQTIEALDAGWFEARFVPGRTRLHAKIYVGDRAATVGSSDFTEAGLATQFEANVRAERVTDSRRYRQAKLAAENYWSVGLPWNDELKALLREMLQLVSWQEALAWACADFLDGQWAASSSRTRLDRERPG